MGQARVSTSIVQDNCAHTYNPTPILEVNPILEQEEARPRFFPDNGQVE